jgi:hypothetical protein
MVDDDSMIDQDEQRDEESSKVTVTTPHVAAENLTENRGEFGVKLIQIL